MRRGQRLGWCLIGTMLCACGGGSTQPADTVTTAPPPDPGPGTDTTATETPTGTDTAQTDTTETPTETPTAARPEPIAPENADQIKEALLEAAGNLEAFRRLVDPDWGIGTFDPADHGLAHHCDMSGLSTNPALGFTIGEGDDFRCDSTMRRCSFEDDDGSGYVFLFRDGEGDAIWLNSIVRHARRVPRFDSTDVTTFARAGDGVCALYGALTNSNAAAPSKLAVFISAQTGQVEESTTAHHCGDEASAAYAQHIAPLIAQGPPDRCQRNPARCTYETGETTVVVYGDADGANAATITRPGMRQALQRQQQAEADQFLMRLRRHTCSD